VIDSATPAAQCDEEGALGNALMAFSMVHKLRNDPSAGCTAVRERKASSNRIDKLFGFMDTCYTILFEGKTKAGLDECKTNSECYTGFCEMGSDYSMQMPGSAPSTKKKCRIPMADFEGPFAACGIDNMDPLLLNWLRKKVGVSSTDSVETFKAKIHEQYAEDTCAGSSAWGYSLSLSFKT
jgi:hypothetical protein